MQHLLDFITEHTLEDQLYFVTQSPAGELALLWRRTEAAHHWQLRPKGREGPAELIARSGLIQELEARGVDMLGVKCELHAMLSAQIAFAELVLRDADRQLEPELVRRFVLGHQGFIRGLQSAVERLTAPPRPSMLIVQGGGERTQLRAGHLSLVR